MSVDHELYNTVQFMKLGTTHKYAYSAKSVMEFLNSVIFA